MQWLLQDFDDTRALARVLDELGISYSWHKVVPFVGELIPEPDILDHRSVILFGSYVLWRYAERKDLWPGVFKVDPFIHQAVWHPYLLNGTDALFLALQDIPNRLLDDNRQWFFRPVDDSKAEAGCVRSSSQIIALAEKVLKLEKQDIPDDSLRHDTQLMLAKPMHIHKEWRVWVVAGDVVTYSLYKDGEQVEYRHEIDDDALAFAKKMAALNKDYSPAYVMDICRIDEGLRLLETNCINAAGFYAADLTMLVGAMESLVL